MLFLVGGLLAACGGSSGSGQSITLYSGQHVQTTDALVAGFEKATGITVNVRSDDEDTLSDQIVDRGEPVAGRRDLHREHTGHPVSGRQGPAGSTVDPSTLANTPSQYNSPTATGWESRPG